MQKKTATPLRGLLNAVSISSYFIAIFGFCAILGVMQMQLLTSYCELFILKKNCETLTLFATSQTVYLLDFLSNRSKRATMVRGERL